MPWPAVGLRCRCGWGHCFNHRASLVAKLVQCEAEAVEFLRRLADRQEWAIKVYLAEDESREPVAAHIAQPAAATLGIGSGTQYLAAKRGQVQRRRQVQVAARQEVRALEETLQPLADSWRQLQVLPTTLTGRTEKMISNGDIPRFCAAGCGHSMPPASDAAANCSPRD